MKKDISNNTYIHVNQQFKRKLGFVFFLFGIMLICSILAFIAGIHQKFLFSILLLVIYVILFIISFFMLKKEDKRFWNFIEQTSTFTHTLHTPITATRVVETLQQNGFSVTPYAFDNYYAVQKFHDGHECHFFLGNHNTPDCEEAEPFSILFIQKVMEIVYKPNSFYINMEIGDLATQSPEYWQTLRKGVLSSKKTAHMFCCNIAYDVTKNTLYFADALFRVTWKKRDINSIYMCDIIAEVCKPYCHFHYTKKRLP